MHHYMTTLSYVITTGFSILRPAFFAGVFVSLLGSVAAQDRFEKIEVKGAFGVKTFTNAKVMAVTDRGVKIAHDDGISVIPISAMPAGWSSSSTGGTVTDAPVAGANGDMPGSAVVSTVKQFDPRCLVFIKTDKGSGTGFIAAVDGRAYLYTNAHVICGQPGSFSTKIVSLKTGTGRSFPAPYEIELSETYDPNSPNGLEDVARFKVALKEDEVAYEMISKEQPLEMGAQIVAYGNSLGGDVLTKLEGQVLALGTDRIEISSEIVPGNSGGPVVDAQNRVVGISTYIDASGKRDIWASGTQFGRVRRFAVRPERVSKWRRMPFVNLQSALKELTMFDRDTLSLAAACFVNPKPNRGGFDVPTVQKGNYIIRQIIIDGGTTTLGASISGGIARVNQRLGAAKGTVAISQVVPVFAQFFTDVAAASSSQMNSLAMTERAPYLKQFVPQLLEERKEVHEDFVRQAVRFR